jgi:Tfp pilus assembly protein PilN
MRSVNLIPEGERPGGGASAGRSGGAVYVLLAALAIVVVLLGTHTYLSKRAGDAQAKADALTAQATQVEAQATALQGQTSFATLRTKRVETVTALVRSRFDWSHALRELARVVPADVTLEGLTASLSPGAGSGSASGAAGGGGVRAALPNPAFELQGCAASQDQVASMLTDLRRIDDVVRVSLESSEKSGSEATAGASSSSGDDGSSCSGSTRPSFSAVVFFQPPAGAALTPTSATP